MNIYHAGLDVGSTTIKVVVMDESGQTRFSLYQRHFSEVRKTIVELLLAASEKFEGESTTLGVTGSGGISASAWIEAEFIQEVVAGAEAIRVFLPQTDVAIELGGEDAKLTFFDSGLDQRMNETCAGGTGAFIDQMASFLRTDPSGLNDLALNFKTIYPIAARCGVFAKTDILPLLNEGAAREDIAASIFQAVVDQTIGGLACGRTIRGRVAFLGGPLFYLPALRLRFVETLKLTPEETLCPDNAQFFVALGAALGSRQFAPVEFRQWAERARNLAAAQLPPEMEPLPPLFHDLAELDNFRERHNSTRLPRADWPLTGGVYLGLDAGSTTTKLVALDYKGRLLHSFYSHNRGNPLKSAISALTELYELMPRQLQILQAGVTGYGEGLLVAALGLDLGEVETVAHYRAASFFAPDVSFIVDIGGQDIKCLSIKNGAIDRLMLNEACSSGCGSFLETFAHTLGLDPPAFAQAALSAPCPVDLGSRCTVFMNSKVKQAQKEGAPVGDISAGLSYSVVRNALYKVIRINRPEDLGEKVVVQGGTFFNDAVLRTFEKTIGREVVRPDIAGLMGAFGMALLARENYADTKITSGIITEDGLDTFRVTTRNTRCSKCENHCLLTINRFSGGNSYISGNRCEGGITAKSTANEQPEAQVQHSNSEDSGDIPEKQNLGETTVVKNFVLGEYPAAEFSSLPNLFQWNLRRLFEAYEPRSASEAKGVVGLPRALGTYGSYPFWFTFFHTLGFRVKLSQKSSKELYNQALDTIPSQTLCYPAKLVHGHVKQLVELKPDFIFLPNIPLDMPVPYPTDNRYNCPLVGSYGELIRLNMDILKESGVPFITPFLDPSSPPKLAKRLKEELSFLHLPSSQIRLALKAAYQEMEQYRNDIHSAGERALDYLQKHDATGIILAGHPYHLDPEVHHGIPEVINANGLAVLTSDSVDHLASPGLKLRMVDQWIPHSRIYRSALVAAKRSDLEMVQLISFGCGLDAVTSDQTGDILEEAGKAYTVIKIDEGSNLGAARIRIRSLAAAIKTRRRNQTPNSTLKMYHYEPATVEKGKMQDYTILVPQMSPLHWAFLPVALAPEGYRLEVLPTVNRQAIEEGLRYVNNDACYPALVSIGQLIHALKTGNYDLSRTAVMMSQTGGGCRASNYVGLLRRALEQSDLGHIPVFPLNLGQNSGSEGIKLDTKLIRRLLMGILYGDMLNRLLLACRPYEKMPGSAQALADHWTAQASPSVSICDWKAFKQNILAMTDDFAGLPLYEADRPKVGLVGEILLNYHHEANNQAVALVEAEGGQAILPELTDFFLYCVYDDVFQAEALAGSWSKKWLSLWMIHLVERYRRPMRQALARHPRFGHLNTFKELVKSGESIVSLGNQTGEGWYLPADMALMIEKGIPNILCLQPFGCMPNHITGKGVVKELKRRYPQANLAAVDYDPGTSEVNQLNRIKLLMTVALRATKPLH